MKLNPTLISRAVAAAVASSLALPVFAADDKRIALEEVTVTARKKEESLQQTPMAVAALDASSIEKLDIKSIDDVARFAPGLSFSKAFGRATERPVIRGMSNVLAGVQFGVEAGAAYFVDGVYYPGDVQGLDLSDVERVEVIKGPQSALYGRNTYSGAINFVTRAPAQEFSGMVKATAAEHGEQDLRVNASGPLIENVLSAGVSLRSYDKDGEWNNTVTDNKIGDESTRSISTVLDWAATDQLNIRLRAQSQRDKDGTRPLFLQSAEANNCAPGLRSMNSVLDPATGWSTPISDNNNQYFCGEIKPGIIALNDGDDADGIPNTIDGVPTGTAGFVGNNYSLTDGTAFDGVERDANLATLLVDYELPSGHTLVAAGSWYDQALKTGSDSDHSSMSFKFTPVIPGVVDDSMEESLFALSQEVEAENTSVELRLESPQDQSLRWMVGYFFYNQDSVTTDLKFTGSLEDESGSTENEAVFASAEYDFSEKLTLSSEIRYAEETKQVTDLDVGNAVGEILFEDSGTWDSVTPRFTLDYQINDEMLAYGVFSKGAKPGGFNGAAGAGINKPTYDQEESTNYEFGLKSTLLDGRLRANAAVFFTEVSDIQLTSTLPTAGTGALTSIVTNQGEGEVLGLELELQAALTESLSAGITYALADTQFTEGCDEFQWTLTSGGGKWTSDEATSLDLTGNGDCSIEGNQFPLGSKHQASAFLDYFRPIGSGAVSFFASGDVSYESKKYVQVHNLAYVGDTTLVGARLGFEGENWRASLFGRNLTDEDSVTMATRWLQLPYLGSPFNLNSAAFVPGGDSSAPRAFFGSLRSGRQLGVDFTYRF